MATSEIAKPFTISPAFNPLRYIYDSTNKNQEGFKYIFDVYEAGTANKIAERKVSAEFATGYGNQQLAKLLQGFVSGDFDPTNNSTFDATNCYYRYDVKIGEEYILPVSYTSALTQNGSFVRITATHSFDVGDAVVIEQNDGGAANPNLEGLFVVTSVNGTTDFTVNSPWSDVTDINIDGEVRYSDNRKTIVRDIVVVSGALVFNGAFSFVDWKTYDEADYITNTSSAKLLTSLPSEFTAYEDQTIYVNSLTNQLPSLLMEFVNSTGDVFRKSLDATAYINQTLVCGSDLQASLSLISGSGNLVEDDVEWYDFTIVNSFGTAQSETNRINIDRRCRINEYQLAFRDRLGSMLSYSFTLHDAQSGTINRTTYNKEVAGSVNGATSRWEYDTHERGMKSVDITEKEVLTLRTNYIKTQDELDLFKELLTSPDVYIEIDGVWQAVTVQDTGYNIPRLRQKRLQRYDIKVMLSNQDVING